MLLPFGVWLAHRRIDPAPRDGMARVIPCGDALVELQHHVLIDFGGAADDFLCHRIFNLLVYSFHHYPPSNTIEPLPGASIKGNVAGLEAGWAHRCHRKTQIDKNILTLIRSSPSAHGTDPAPAFRLLVQEHREQEALIGDGLDVERDRGERELPSYRGEGDRRHLEEDDVRRLLGVDRHRRRREWLTPHLSRGPG